MTSSKYFSFLCGLYSRPKPENIEHRSGHETKKASRTFGPKNILHGNGRSGDATTKYKMMYNFRLKKCRAVVYSMRAISSC